MKNYLLIILCLLPALHLAQSKIMVSETGTEVPVRRAAVLCNDQILGYTDAKGELTFRTKCRQIDIKASGYDRENAVVDKVIQVGLSKTDPNTKSIEEVIITDKSDPRALAILKLVNDSYADNMPSSLDSYRYKSYEKISVDIDEDSLQYYNQSLSSMMKMMDRFSMTKKQPEDTAVTVKEVFANSKLFLWERAQEFLYSKKYGEKINVLDNRVAGLNEPLYELMAVQSNRNRMPKEIREENRNLYRYFLTDSIDIEGRKNYVISFREVTYRQPVQRRKFNGYLYVDAATYGLKKIESNSKIKSDGTITSIWQLIYGKWFLQSENLKMKLTNMNMEPESKDKSKAKVSDRSAAQDKTPDNFRTYAFVTSAYFDHESPTDDKASDFRGYTFSVKNSDGSLLQQYRKEPLSSREQNTYEVIDSLGQKYNIDRRAGQLAGLARGKFRYRQVDFDLGKLIGYNLYEGIRLGIAAKLNEKFNPYISPDAYIAYGFKDRGIKYGAGIDFTTSLERTSVIRAEYYNDVMAAGRFSENFWDFRMKLNNSGIAINNDRFYLFEGAKLSYDYDVSNSVSMKLAVRRQSEESAFPYSYKGLGNEFENTSALLSLKFSPFSKNIMTPQGKFTTEKKYPELFLNYEQAFEALGGDFSFGKLDMLFNHNFKNRLGVTGIRIYGGIMLGDAPIWHHYTMNGLAGSSNFKFNLTSYLGFSTMKGGQYFNDKFIGQYFTHRIPWYFKSIGQNSSSFDVIHRSVIGNMKDPEFHQFEFKKLDHLYQEVGLEWNNFLSSYFNLGLFYRVGYYNTPKFSDNFAVQLKFKLLGF
ncbi:hypothetical protein H1R16_03660 [Marnyiella aurantia]|uniref:Carboxypeptidase-like regulatory domain-containing protein n=1 Tax=Marnyiella aurantia TaxID=2758037 RepID=A0A7D7LRI9_9FLAO|nr:hypothetical protein [Marnyiella aurantia]MBA5247354.1 hypothetical protein [Marnyiella aurantia]QMS99114.1 hypothetical protein H1R16_03660 [Marnyiella aurantia]